MHAQLKLGEAGVVGTRLLLLSRRKLIGCVLALAIVAGVGWLLLLQASGLVGKLATDSEVFFPSALTGALWRIRRR